MLATYMKPPTLRTTKPPKKTTAKVFRISFPGHIVDHSRQDFSMEDQHSIERRYRNRDTLDKEERISSKSRIVSTPYFTVIIKIGLN